MFRYKKIPPSSTPTRPQTIKITEDANTDTTPLEDRKRAPDNSLNDETSDSSVLRKKQKNYGESEVVVADVERRMRQEDCDQVTATTESRLERQIEDQEIELSRVN